MRKENKIKKVILNKEKQRLNKKNKMFMKETKDVILEEVMEELNFIEKLFFKRKFIKIYNKSRVNCINAMLK